MYTKKTIFIEIPTWLGDAVMTTPAIENIVHHFQNCELIIFGSYVSTRLFLHHPNVKIIIVDDSKKEGNRYINLYKLAKKEKKIDVAFSFRKNFTTTFLFWFISAKTKFIYKRLNNNTTTHQVIRYNDFINNSLNIKSIPNKLKIYRCLTTTIKQDKPLSVGINPGATYGSAKRWYPLEFAKVAMELSKRYDIKIFGGASEVDIASDIEKVLISNNIVNYQNLAGKTTIDELIEEISTLDLFITNDSGPMHLSATFDIPTVAIFGPTRDTETHQWKNDKEFIIRKKFDCAPCMKRICPLKDKNKYHQCMKQIKYTDVINILKKESLI